MDYNVFAVLQPTGVNDPDLCSNSPVFGWGASPARLMGPYVMDAGVWDGFLATLHDQIDDSDREMVTSSDTWSFGGGGAHCCWVSYCF